jgi:hypothetical protein
MNTQQKLWIDACVADYAEQLSHSGGHSADDVARELAAYREELEREISEEEKAVVRDRSPENGSASDAG